MTQRRRSRWTPIIDRTRLHPKTRPGKDFTKRNCFYIGRGIDYYTCLEAALKLKEISYIQTEGFAAGELKHGTIALIEEGVPVIAIVSQIAI
ncbi:MAG: SIS domain-containing protein [Bacillus subtilis]|nr:SIS domain-containing protein [Bacillus subtilis]